MSKPKLTKCLVTCGLALVSLLGVIWISSNYEIVDPATLSSDTDIVVSQSAIAQAIFSVLAILAAIWLGERQARSGRRERVLERERLAAIYAVVLRTQIEAVRLEALFKMKVVSARLKLVTTAPRGPYVIKDGDRIRRRLYIASGDVVLSGIEAATHFEKEAAIKIAEVIENFKGYNRTLEDAVFKLVDVYPHPSMQGSIAPPAEEIQPFYEEILRRLSVIADGCAQAEYTLERTT